MRLGLSWGLASDVTTGSERYREWRALRGSCPDAPASDHDIIVMYTPVCVGAGAPGRLLHSAPSVVS
jgi:hypothetical protein